MSEGLILIVDDVPRNLQVLGSMLRSSGYDVAFASSGQQALNLARARRPDLILLDIMMPDMDGYETCANFRQDEQLSSIPILFLTAKTETADVLKAFEVGGVDYVTKPFRSVELLARAKTHIQLSRARARLGELNADLKRSNQAKERFLSILGHDLRGPFTVFLSMADLMLMQIRSGNLEKLEQSVKRMRDMVKRLHSLLENLLEWGRLQKEGDVLHPREFAAGYELRRVIQHLQDVASAKQIEFATQLPEGPRAYGDPNMFQTVARNLIGNAIKFSPRGSTISIRLTALEGEVEVEVEDQGIGMDESLQEQLFHVDQSVTRSGTEEERGTGLGLILCREYVTQNGGRIRARSKPREGSCFTFSFPDRSAAEPNRPL